MPRPIDTAKLPRAYRPTMMPGRPRGYLNAFLYGAGAAFLLWWLVR